jgi:hypothetical protein
VDQALGGGVFLNKLGLEYKVANVVTNCSFVATGRNTISSGRTTAPKSMMVRDAFVLPGQMMQILPSSASSAAQILMQSASSSFDGACESTAPGGLQTIHSPLSSIAGSRIQIESL